MSPRSFPIAPMATSIRVLTWVLLSVPLFLVWGASRGTGECLVLIERSGARPLLITPSDAESFAVGLRAVAAD